MPVIKDVEGKFRNIPDSPPEIIQIYHMNKTMELVFVTTFAFIIGSIVGFLVNTLLK